jgi:hypothetical protein
MTNTTECDQCECGFLTNGSTTCDPCRVKLLEKDRNEWRATWEDLRDKVYDTCCNSGVRIKHDFGPAVALRDYKTKYEILETKNLILTLALSRVSTCVTDAARDLTDRNKGYQTGGIIGSSPSIANSEKLKPKTPPQN